MEILTIMVVSSAMKDKSKCYVKVVEENYHDEDEVLIPEIHLIFLSKRDYNKIKEIEEMIKKYFNLEEKYIKSEKEYIIYYYLKEIIRYLKECEVMEVLSDHIDAFHLKFHYISEFIMKSKRMRPHRPLFSSEGNDNDEEYISEFAIYSHEKNTSERMKKKIFKVGDFLLDKIRFE